MKVREMTTGKTTGTTSSDKKRLNSGRMGTKTTGNISMTPGKKMILTSK